MSEMTNTKAEEPARGRGRPIQTPTWRGDRMREGRIARGLSLRAFGRMVGVDASTVLRWERGDFTPPGEMLGKIARATRVKKSRLAPAGR